MPESARDILKALAPDFSAMRAGRLYSDTTQFMSISHGDVILLDGRHYLVMRDEAERRFGMEDPKFWVKRCKQLESGERRILKLVFHEKFMMKLGSGLEVPCYRSPEKEAEVLDLVRDDPRFMHGFSARDTAGNLVRVLEVIQGKRLDVVLDGLAEDHETYFFRTFPPVFDEFIESVRAVKMLHDHGYRHGDVRRDHLWLDRQSRRYRWIDFDYTFQSYENPYGVDIFGLLNVFLFLAGKGIHTRASLAEQGRKDLAASLEPEDFSLMYRNRIMNLGKLFPYVPESVTGILRLYCIGSDTFYDTTEELLHDLLRCREDVASMQGAEP
jgi:hypothetical protein